MKLDYYPEWNISFWYTNSAFNYKIVDALDLLYNNYISCKLEKMNVDVNIFANEKSNSDESLRKLKKLKLPKVLWLSKLKFLQDLVIEDVPHYHLFLL